MERFLEIMRRHPLWIFGGVVAVVLLFWFAGRGGGSSQPVIVSTGPSDMTVAQNAETERARIAAQQQGAAGVVATELAKIQADAYTAFLGTSRNVADIQADRDVQIAGIAGNTQTSLASIITGATTAQTQIHATAATDLANIDKAKSESLANINAALQREQIQGQNAAAAAAASSAITIEQIKAQNVLDMQNLKGAQMGPMGIFPNIMTALLTGYGGPSSTTEVSLSQGTDHYWGGAT